ncbi:MAG: NifB/NifX family molybdenum-iron cluster-binding protein [Armatimonadota bacterium]
MKIAIPTRDGTLCAHFGHCEEFTFVDIDRDAKQIKGVQRVPAPPHEPGLLPRWLKERGAEVVIAGGMGTRARTIFAESGIEVIVGAPQARPEEVVQSYMDGTLELGDNVCDHT